MEKLIETLVRPLVDYPEQISVTKEEFDTKMVYTLHVHDEDMGKVIGKQGRIAKAIRTVVYAAASKQKKRVILEIHE